MPTSAREEIANLPQITIKTVLSAGPMWASAPTARMGKDIAVEGFLTGLLIMREAKAFPGEEGCNALSVSLADSSPRGRAKLGNSEG